MLYRGEPAQLKREDRDILVMKWMGWSYADLENAPYNLIERIREHMRAESEAMKRARAKSAQPKAAPRRATPNRAVRRR